MTRAINEAAGLDQSERELIQQSCQLLELGPVSDVEKISVGKSGALVARLGVTDRKIILKITTEAGRLARAAFELRMISEHPAGLTEVMPRFVAGHRDKDMVCLATEEHQPLPHPAHLSTGEWSALATALGKLHSTPLPSWTELSTRPDPDVRSINHAAVLWTELGRADDAQRAADHLLHDIATTPADTDSLTPCLMHGDCHVENMVRDELGMFRWIDWQEAQIGNGLGDLIFLWQRAEFAGASPPRQVMLGAYAQARHQESDTSLQQALDIAELRLLFISWPPFLSYGTPEGQQTMKRRLTQLVDALEATATP